MKKNNFFNLIVRKNITSETMLAYVAESFVFIFMVIYEHLFLPVVHDDIGRSQSDFKNFLK